MTTGDTSEARDRAATRDGEATLSALDLLVEIGSDLFAVISRPKPEHYPVNLWPDLREALEQHPSLDRLHAAINDHPELQPLYCGSLSARRDTLLAGVADDIHMVLAASSGYSTPLFLWEVAKYLLSTARRLQVVRGELDLTGFQDAIRQVWAWTCELAQGHEIRVPVVIGIANIEVRPGYRYAFDSETILCGLEPSLNELVGLGIRKPTAILILHHPVQLLARGEAVAKQQARGKGELDPFGKEIGRHHELLRLHIDQVRLALLLGSDYPDLATPIAVSELIVEPFNNIYGGPAFVPLHSPFPQLMLDEAKLQQASLWLARIRQAGPHAEPIRFGIGRFLSAATSREDLRDGFVDAVICWDSILGTTSGEVTFRITAALAWLAAPDDRHARQQAYDAIKKLYDRRSKIVHGSSKQPPGSEAATDRNEALRYCHVALREMFRRPALLASKERAHNILLDLVD